MLSSLRSTEIPCSAFALVLPFYALMDGESMIMRIVSTLETYPVSRENNIRIFMKDTPQSMANSVIL